MIVSEDAILRGKRVLVTGGTRGLGREICRVFASEGANVAFTYARNREQAKEVEQEIAILGAQSLAFQVSVLDRVETSKMIKVIEKEWESIDILVNNAGITQSLPLALLEEEDWDKVMDLNVKGTFLTSKAVVRGMIRRKSGTILNIGSIAGTRMLDAPIHYCTSKAALIGLTLSMAREVARYSIRINLLAPGLLEGGIGLNIPDHRLKDYLQHCSMGRLGKFEEVAEFAAFLVSDSNSFMTGETIIMDGGL